MIRLKMAGEIVHKVKCILYLLCVFFLSASCSGNKAVNGGFDNSLDAVITGYNEFTCAELNITMEEMKSAGFVPGDILSVSIGGEVLELPYHTGFFTRIGEMLVVDYPTYAHTVITASTTGLSKKFQELTGQHITLRLKEKGGAAAIETALGRTYSNDRSEYSGDAEFANARMVGTTGMAKGRLYRSASPFDNQFGRAPFVSAYLREQGVKTVLDLSDDEKKIRTYDELPEHSRLLIESGNVIFCKVNTNYRSDDFNARLIAGLMEMSSRPAPYVIHCTEGKDRTGYVCALLEALAGASYEEIAADYLVTYRNYFGITPENNPSECKMLLSLRLNDALMYYCDITDESRLGMINLRDAVSRYLLNHNMTRNQLDDLVRALCE